uniref:Uncharacterized protein n=1 Tax=Riboviria sp. TaxID=2585031 RepID=A0A8B0RQ10_9VIRU|nr:hypothetical protein [Riboviria sp.]
MKSSLFASSSLLSCSFFLSIFALTMSARTQRPEPHGLMQLMGCSANLPCEERHIAALPDFVMLIPKTICLSTKHVTEILFLPATSCQVRDVFPRKSKVGWKNYECMVYVQGTEMPKLPKGCHDFTGIPVPRGGLLIVGSPKGTFTNTLVGSHSMNHLCLDGEKYPIYDKVTDYITGQFITEDDVKRAEIHGDELGIELFDYGLLDRILDPPDRSYNFHLPTNCHQNVQELCLERTSTYFKIGGPKTLGMALVSRSTCERGYAFFNTTHQVCIDYFLYGETICADQLFKKVSPRSFYKYGVIASTPSEPVLTAKKVSNLTLEINQTYFQLNDLKDDLFDRLKRTMPVKMEITAPVLNKSFKNHTDVIYKLFERFHKLELSTRTFYNRTYETILDRLFRSMKPQGYQGVGGFFDWFYNIMEKLIDPFVSAFEKMLTALIKIFIELAIKAIRDVLVFLIDLIKETVVLLKALLESLQHVVEELMPVLSDLFGVLLKFFSDLFKTLDKSFRIMEYFALYACLSVFLVNNDFVVTIIALIVGIHFGVVREEGEPSLLNATVLFFNKTRQN